MRPFLVKDGRHLASVVTFGTPEWVSLCVVAVPGAPRELTRVKQRGVMWAHPAGQQAEDSSTSITWHRVSRLQILLPGTTKWPSRSDRERLTEGSHHALRFQEGRRCWRQRRYGLAGCR